MKIKASEGFKKLFTDAQKSPHYHAQKHQLEIAEAVYNYKQRHNLTAKEIARYRAANNSRCHKGAVI